MDRLPLGVRMVVGGDAHLTGVRFVDGGALPPAYQALAFGGGSMCVTVEAALPCPKCAPGGLPKLFHGTVRMERCTLVPRVGGGVSAGIGGYFRHNVLYTGSVKGCDRCTLLDNLVASANWHGYPAGGAGFDGGYAGFGIMGKRGSLVRGNAVAQAQTCLQFFNGFDTPIANFSQNSGHDCEIGIGVLGQVMQPISDVTLFQIYWAGFWCYEQTFHEGMAPVVTNIRMADFESAFFWAGVGKSRDSSPTPLPSSPLFLI